MNTKHLLIASLLLAPLWVSADSTTTPPNNASTSQSAFVLCSQKAIDTRDAKIAEARAIYNKEMDTFMLARKDAEKKIVLIEDDTEKKAAVKKAVDSYKTSIKKTQETLKDARALAWDEFDKAMEKCRIEKKAGKAHVIEEKKSALKESGDREENKKKEGFFETAKSRLEALRKH